MGLTVDVEATASANALAAIVVKRHGFYIALEQCVVEVVQHLHERHLSDTSREQGDTKPI